MANDRRPTTDDQSMRVLVLAPNWLGDIVMSLPAIAGLRRHFETATLAVAGPAALAPAFNAAEDVEEIVGLPGGGAFRTADDIAVVAEGQFDVAILFPNSFRAAWVVNRAGVQERWGYRTDFRGRLLTRPVAKPRRRRGRVHHAQYYRDLVRGLDIDPGEHTARLRASDDMLARAAVLLERRHAAAEGVYVGIAPGAAYGYAKRWPAERFGEVVVQLERELGATCVLLGTAGDRDAGRAIESAVESAGRAGRAAGDRPGRLVNLIGSTDIRALIGVISRCQAFLSNDSGAMHLAAALGVPVTAVFGPSNEHETAPLGDHTVLTNPVWCRPCLLRECPIDHRCMKGISSDCVADAVARHVRSAGTRMDTA